MANPRLVVAMVLAGGALALAVFGMIGEGSITGTSGHASLAASHLAGLSVGHIPGLTSLALSAGAFIISWGRRSYIVAGLLIAAGILYMIHLAPFLGDHSVIAFPGPVVGLFLGHVILGLGVAMGIGSAKIRIVQSPNK